MKKAKLLAVTVLMLVFGNVSLYFGKCVAALWIFEDDRSYFWLMLFFFLLSPIAFAAALIAVAKEVAAARRRAAPGERENPFLEKAPRILGIAAAAVAAVLLGLFAYFRWFRPGGICKTEGHTLIGVNMLARDSVATFVIPGGTTAIGKHAFLGCGNLTQVVIPDSVTSIGEGAFALCRNLGEVDIPDRVIHIGPAAFAGVPKVKVGSANPVFALDPAGALINRRTRELVYLPPGHAGRYALPGNVEKIGARAFSQCADLTEVDIPCCVTGIGAGAFAGCGNLAAVNIPDSVTEIGAGAFAECVKLKRLTIPRNCAVGEWAFPDDCTVVRR